MLVYFSINLNTAYELRLPECWNAYIYFYVLNWIWFIVALPEKARHENSGSWSPSTLNWPSVKNIDWNTRNAPSFQSHGLPHQKSTRDCSWFSLFMWKQMPCYACSSPTQTHNTGKKSHFSPLSPFLHLDPLADGAPTSSERPASHQPKWTTPSSPPLLPSWLRIGE